MSSSVPNSPLPLPCLSAPTPGTLALEVLVAPRASSNRIIGLHAGRLKIGITAPPVDGAANEHTVRFVAEVLGVTKGQVTLARGATGRRKRLLIAGISLGEAIQRLQGALPEERKTP